MPRGGARPGAGRKPKAKGAEAPNAAVVCAARPPDADLSDLTPLDYLLSVVRDPGSDQRVRIQAASIAAPFVHMKKGEGGKKDGQAAAAKQVAGRFSASAPPKLVAAGGRKV